MEEPTILVVDPDADRRGRTVADLRSRLDGSYLEAGDAGAAIDALDEQVVDWVVTEQRLPDSSGLDLIESVREQSPDAACVLFTGADTERLDTGDGRAEVFEYVPRTNSDSVERLADLVETMQGLRSQSSYPLPDDEDERLAALADLGLDAERISDHLDSITTLVAAHFDVPTASINLVKEYSQEFLTCHGADWTATHRSDSVCTFTVAAEERVMTVPDVREDPRFDGIDALEVTAIRAYMGATLLTEAGHAIGTLCVYDDDPRRFTPAEQEALVAFADVVMGLVELNCDLQAATRSGGEDGE